MKQLDPKVAQFLMWVAAVAFVVIGVYIYQTENGNPDKIGRKILEVRLEVMNPLNSPPVGATWLVSSQGTVSYEDTEKEIESRKITEQQFNDLADLIAKNNFWRYADNRDLPDYSMDGTVYRVSVKDDGETHFVKCIISCSPKVNEIISKIKEL